MTVLVLDIGSSSVRALLFDDHAQLIPNAIAAQPQQIAADPPGAATLDMLTVQNRVEACIDRILQHPAAQQIRVVGMDTLVGNVLGVSPTGLPLTPIYTYADTRSADSAARLRAEIAPEKKHQDTGAIIHTAYLPARLHWLQHAEGEVYAQVARWVDLGTFLYGMWFGKALASYSVASWSGMFNRARLDWDEEWLRLLGLEHATLPPLADYTTTVSGLTPGYAARWPLLRNVPFCLPVGDGAAANIGAGCVEPSHIALTVGTTAALRTITHQAPALPPGLWSYRVDRSLHLIGGATTEGGSVFQWAQETLKLPSPRDAESALAQRLPDSHGLVFLPLLAGERSPGWASNASGAIAGLRMSTTPLDILQAALEGVALRLSIIHDQLREVAASQARIIASGGALRASPAWTQMIASALNEPLYVTEETELTARGTAILALRAIGAASLTDYPPTIATVVPPQAEFVPLYRQARQRQTALYRTLLDLKFGA